MILYEEYALKKLKNNIIIINCINDIKYELLHLSHIIIIYWITIYE